MTSRVEVIGDDPGAGAPSGGGGFSRAQEFRKLVGEKTWEEMSHLKTENTLKPSQVLVYEGGNPMGLFVVLKGKLQVWRTVASAERKILRNSGPGDLLGLWSLLATWPYPATVQALEASQVGFISRHAFFSLLEQDAALPCRLLQGLARSLLRVGKGPDGLNVGHLL